MAALALLIAIDLTLSGGSHLTRNLVRADDAGELWELVTRRYELAWRILTADKPASLLAALLAVAFAWRNRARLYARCRTGRGPRRCSAGWPPASRAR